MATPVTLRFVWPAGEATFHLTPEEALAATVALRQLGLGLAYRNGATAAMKTTCTAKFTAAERILRLVRRGQQACR